MWSSSRERERERGGRRAQGAANGLSLRANINHSECTGCFEGGRDGVTSQFIQKHEISVYTPTILKFKRCAMNVGMCDCMCVCVCVCTIITAVQWKNKYGAKSRLHTHRGRGKGTHTQAHPFWGHSHITHHANFRHVEHTKQRRGT